MKTSALAGGGLLLACHLPFGSRNAVAAGETVFAPNAFLRIGKDESVTVIVNKSEMGQGVYTSLPMLLAEELCCDWKRVTFQASPVAPEYNHAQFGPIMVTGGSTSVRSEWDRLSVAGAAAREMLVAAAAQQWKVDPAACRAENGMVHGPGGKQLSFGKLAARAAKLPVPKEPKLKSGSKKTARQAAPPSGQSGQDQRYGRLRHRRPSAGHADRRHRPSAGLRRHGSKALTQPRPRLSPGCIQWWRLMRAWRWWPTASGRH